MLSYKDVLLNILDAQVLPVYEVREPMPGIRHSKRTEYVRHRFPVKNGLTSREVLERQISASNPLFEYMLRKAS